MARSDEQQRATTPNASAIRAAIAFGVLAAVLSPFFFVIYRLAIFHTVPYDNYGYFLLWLVGDPQGGLPESPYCYRILSMVLALPLYYLLPVLHLTNIPADLTPNYIRATAALSALAFLASIIGTMLAWRLATTKGCLDRSDSMLAGALFFALCWHAQMLALDPLALTLITAGLCVVDRRWAFGALVIVSVLVDEKIALVLALWLSVRCVLHRDARAQLWQQWVAALAALALYVVIVKVVSVPGNAYQMDVSHYPSTAVENLAVYLTGRGLALNMLPILVLSGLAAAGLLGRAHRAGRWFRATDLLVIPALFLVALLVTQFYQAGRIVMHAAPIFVVPAIAALTSRGRSADERDFRR